MVTVNRNPSSPSAPSAEPTSRAPSGTTGTTGTPGESTPTGNTVPYTVQAGDTMFSIAKRNALQLEDLERANPQVRDSSKIQVGQTLQLPARQTLGTATTPAEATGAPASTTGAADASTVRGSRARARTADVAARARLEQGASAPSAAAAAQGVVPRALTSRGDIKLGAEGPAVTELQEQLNARGASLRVDGDFGPNTDRAVRDFQRRQGIDVDGVVGKDTRTAFARTAEGASGASGAATGPSAPPAVLRSGMEGPSVEALQTQLNEVAGAGLRVDGDFGKKTRAAVEGFQRRAGLEVDGEVGAETRRALDEVAAGTRQLAPADAPPSAPPVTGGAASGPSSRTIDVGGNEIRAHNLTRSQIDRRSVPGRRVISLDANSASGREEVLRPLVVIPNNATPAERRAAQQAADRVAQWLNQNLGGDRATTGLVRTTAENGRGIGGFFHTEFHSVNDTPAVNLIKERPQEYARILAETLGQVPGANFIVPHGNRRGSTIDPGAVSRDGSTSEIGLGRIIIQEGFFQL